MLQLAGWGGVGETALLGELMLRMENLDSKALDSAPQRPVCIVCGGDTAQRFLKEFRGQQIGYFRCLACGHLTAGDIGDVPDYDRDTYFAEVDTGWENRNRSVLQFLRLVSRLPGIDLPRKSLVLDYGCGIGKLVGDLTAAGFDAYGFEPYQKNFENSERIFSDWAEAQEVVRGGRLVTCIEVLEHVRDPDNLLHKISELLASDGYLLISTETYKKQRHTDDWYYLNPAAGHVSIYTEKSLRLLMARHGFSSILRISGIVWLFRLVAQRKRTWLESGYFCASQSRIKLGVRLKPRSEG